MKSRSPIPRTSAPRKVSKKREAENGGKVVYSTIRAAKKPIAKRNPERQKKAAKRGAAKHRAYMASQTRKDVEARSGGVCEYVMRFSPALVREFTGVAKWEHHRCESPATDHHHKTYARYGGNELPKDILHVCKPHHDYLESLKPAGNRYSRQRECARRGIE